MFHILRLESTVDLSEPLKDNGIIVFQSDKLDLEPSPNLGPTGIDNTNVNLINAKGDVLLHIGIRRRENAFVFNSIPYGESRGPEERIPLEGTFGDRRDPSITVFDHPDRYQIMIDYKTVYYYKKRLEGRCEKVSYKINEGQTPPFSDVLGVTVLYFANVMPRAN
ncbi:CGL3 lectin [Coprinopsis cinerea okayama7|uniref:Galectin-3 n=1 Tax=Coprinopsis cinerea (strain Okayama-7 / 130 / ATCC MYA-4618 / FGSC 9003) TaxID=240176 RepID=CGL3_COPC7|nr:CGL3 lectin [Coprinopsis cinerea okayama7\|eukprot:XP_001829544.1 CGL3 lectin [Coprinopsis cinerea okayama7\